MATETKRSLMAKIPKYDDLEIHISLVFHGDEEFIEIREYVPSLQTYGKGHTMTADVARQVHERLGAVLR